MNNIAIMTDRSGWSKNILVIITSLLTIAAVTYSLFQYNTIAALENQTRSLDATAKTTADKNITLSKDNANMKKALLTLQAQIKTTDTDSADEAPVTNPGSKISVTKVSHQPITVPANNSHGPLSTDYFAINATITNLSGSNQTYTTDNFYAITDSGTVVKIPSFGPAIEQTVWRSESLAPGGHVDIVLLFPSDQNLVTLTITVPNTTDQLIAALPAAQ